MPNVLHVLLLLVNAQSVQLELREQGFSLYVGVILVIIK